MDVECATPKESLNDRDESIEPGKDVANVVEVVTDLGNDVSLPMNWPLGKKVFNVAVPSLLGFVM